MAAVSATGMAISLPSQLNNHPQNHTLIPPKSSHLLKSPVRRITPAPVCRAHCSSTISDSLSNHHHHHLSSSSSSAAAFFEITRSAAAGNPVLIDLDPATAKLESGIFFFSS